MLLWMFGFFALFFGVYWGYTRHLTAKRFTVWGDAVFALLSATLLGAMIVRLPEGFARNFWQGLLLLLLVAGLLAAELLYCLGLSSCLVPRYRHMLHLVQLYHKGMLLEMPYPQGEELYWVDVSTPTPCVRKMYFVALVSGCYIGVYRNSKHLVVVREVFTDRKIARQVLSNFYLHPRF